LFSLGIGKTQAATCSLSERRQENTHAALPGCRLPKDSVPSPGSGNKTNSRRMYYVILFNTVMSSLHWMCTVVAAHSCPLQTCWAVPSVSSDWALRTRRRQKLPTCVCCLYTVLRHNLMCALYLWFMLDVMWPPLLTVHVVALLPALLSCTGVLKEMGNAIFQICSTMVITVLGRLVHYKVHSIALV